MLFLNARLLCINVLLLLGKLAKFGNAYQEAIGRKKKCMDGGKHANIENKRKKINNIGNTGDSVNM